MFEIAVFALVLIVIFAVKAVSVILMADDVIWKSTAFSWLKAAREDTVAAREAGLVEQAKPAGTSAQVVRPYSRRRPTAA